MVIDDTASPGPNGARFFDMEVDDQGSSAPCRGTWQLRVRGNTITAGGRYDAWIWFSSFGSGRLEALWTVPENARPISVPGTAFNVTTVGAYISKFDWLSRDGATYHFVGTVATDVGRVAWFSSPGPTRDGRIKPDINAPALAIVSSLSQDVPTTTQNTQLTVEDTVHWALPGTSFSAPHVAGVYAQILALKPNLDAIELRTLATSTARVDANVSLPIPNNNWGSGKLNALGAAQAACPAEVCDSLDNDCDGTADNGFDVGQACTVGVGACRASGVTICDAAGTGTTCGARPGEPGAEICDGLDNDCDGTVDVDPAGQPPAARCSTGPAGPSGVGPWHPGVAVCSSG